MLEQPRKLSGLVLDWDEPEEKISDFWVGSSMVEQRPFKALVVGSSPTQPTSPGVRHNSLKNSG